MGKVAARAFIQVQYGYFLSETDRNSGITPVNLASSRTIVSPRLQVLDHKPKETKKMTENPKTEF